MFIGGCELRKTLSSLSPDGWIRVPSLLVVWPETPQHGSLQAILLDQVLVSKWWPLGQFMPMSTPQYLHHHVLVPTVNHSHPLPPQETLQDKQVGLA